MAADYPYVADMANAFRVNGSKSCDRTRRFQSDSLPFAAEAQRNAMLHMIFIDSK